MGIKLLLELLLGTGTPSISVVSFGALKPSQFQSHLRSHPSSFWLAPKGTKKAFSSSGAPYPERFYSPSGLIKTLKIRPGFSSGDLWFSPHNIEKLGKLCTQIDPEFADIFPMENKFHSRSFHRLQRAYIDARYSEHYEITVEELDYLAGMVEKLKGLVQNRLTRSEVASGGFVNDTEI